MMTESPFANHPQLRGFLGQVRTHIVPIAFLVGATIEITLSVLDLAVTENISLFSDPVFGIVIGILYLALGGAYEWTIRAQQRNEQRYQEQRELLQKQKEQIEAMEAGENND